MSSGVSPRQSSWVRSCSPPLSPWLNAVLQNQWCSLGEERKQEQLLSIACLIRLYSPRILKAHAFRITASFGNLLFRTVRNPRSRPFWKRRKKFLRSPRDASTGSDCQIALKLHPIISYEPTKGTLSVSIPNPPVTIPKTDSNRERLVPIQSLASKRKRTPSGKCHQRETRHPADTSPVITAPGRSRAHVRFKRSRLFDSKDPRTRGTQNDRARPCRYYRVRLRQSSVKSDWKRKRGPVRSSFEVRRAALGYQSSSDLFLGPD